MIKPPDPKKGALKGEEGSCVVKQVLFFLLPLLIFSRSSSAFDVKCDVRASVNYSFDSNHTVSMQKFTMANLCNKFETLDKCKQRWLGVFSRDEKKNPTEILKAVLRTPSLLSEEIKQRIDKSSRPQGVVDFLFSLQQIDFRVKDSFSEDYRSGKGLKTVTLQDLISIEPSLLVKDLYSEFERKDRVSSIKKTAKLTHSLAGLPEEVAGISGEGGLFSFGPDFWFLPKTHKIRFYPLVAMGETKPYFVLTGILPGGEVVYSNARKFLRSQLRSSNGAEVFTSKIEDSGSEPFEIDVKVMMKCDSELVQEFLKISDLRKKHWNH